MSGNGGIIAVANALYFIQKARVAAQVRVSHLAKNNEKCELTENVTLKTGELEGWLNDEIKKAVQAHPAYDWFSKVKGIGDVNIGKVVALIDINEASQVSKLWRYALGAPFNGKVERQTKGEKLHYNKTLKSMCWRLGKSLIRGKGAYYDYYREQKARLVRRVADEGGSVVPSLQLPLEHGKHVEKDGFVGLGHVDAMAMRKMLKLFLSHLWMKWREAEGLPITMPYIHAIKGHTDYRGPEEFIEASYST